MSYSPKLASAFNDTQMRSEKIAPSGMCSFCAEECVGTCEIGVSAMRGEMAVYPTNTGANQVASEKVMRLTGRISILMVASSAPSAHLPTATRRRSLM